MISIKFKTKSLEAFGNFTLWSEEPLTINVKLKVFMFM